MIKSLLIFFIIILNFNYAASRNTGETEVTTEDGIEVFQEEKYYLLKKNVEILSDDFDLNGQLVKIFFENDLYDMRELIANDDVSFVSSAYNVSGKGDYLHFEIKTQKIHVNGISSELKLENTEMYSDGDIRVDNLNGSFSIEGANSKLISDDTTIIASKINGIFEMIDGKRNISKIEVEDSNMANIKTDDIDMFSKKAVYEKNKSIIELFKDVKINRGGEIITGDYGIFNTNKKSYKVSSKDTKKVKAIITNTNE